MELEPFSVLECICALKLYIQCLSHSNMKQTAVRSYFRCVRKRLCVYVHMLYFSLQTVSVLYQPKWALMCADGSVSRRVYNSTEPLKSSARFIPPYAFSL